MSIDTGTARDDVEPGATDTDDLIRLIMSGEQPPPGLRVDGTAEAIAAGRSPVGLSPIEANPFWAVPPATSNPSQPRVEARFTRGVDYTTPDLAEPTPDVASLDDMVVATKLEVADVVESEVEPQTIFEVAVVDAVVPMPPDAAFRDESVTHRDAAWTRPLPAPQTRALGADYVRDLDDAEAIQTREPAAHDVVVRGGPETADANASDVDDRSAPSEPAEVTAVAEAAPPPRPSPLDAAINPYVRQRTGEQEAESAREHLRQTWHKA